MSAMTSLQPQATGTVVVPAPLLSKKKAPAKQKTMASDESTGTIVRKLADLRARYLPEMQAARDRVKKNFLHQQKK